MKETPKSVNDLIVNVQMSGSLKDSDSLASDSDLKSSLELNFSSVDSKIAFYGPMVTNKIKPQNQ